MFANLVIHAAYPRTLMRRAALRHQEDQVCTFTYGLQAPCAAEISKFYEPL